MLLAKVGPFDQNLCKLKQISGGERIYLSPLRD